LFPLSAADGIALPGVDQALDAATFLELGVERVIGGALVGIEVDAGRGIAGNRREHCIEVEDCRRRHTLDPPHSRRDLASITAPPGTPHAPRSNPWRFGHPCLTPSRAVFRHRRP